MTVTLRFYPAASLPWALEVASLTRSEIAYGIDNGLLKAAAAEFATQNELDGVGEIELRDARDTLFRLLLVNLYKNWFLCDRPFRALEFLVVDFEDCPTAGMDGGKLLSGVAGIAERGNLRELDPEHFLQKVKGFQFLTKYVVQIVHEGIRSGTLRARESG